MMNTKRLPRIWAGALLVSGPLLTGADALLWPCAFAEEALPQHSPSPADDSPRLQLDETVVDFGEVAPNAQVAHTVRLRNIGPTPLDIVELKTSCRCLSVHTASPTIEPGGRGTLEVTFDATGRQGRQQKAVTLETNDLFNPVMRIRIKAMVKGDFEVTPHRVRFGDIRLGQEAVDTITVVPIGKEPLHVTHVESTSKHFVSTYSEAVRADQRKGYIVTVRLSPQVALTRRSPGKKRTLTGKIRIFTDSPRQPVIAVPVVASLRPIDEALLNLDPRGDG